MFQQVLAKSDFDGKFSSKLENSLQGKIISKDPCLSSSSSTTCMLYVYILKSQINNRIYIGITSDLTRRLKEHNRGKSYFTNQYKPWRIIYFEGYKNENFARLREKRLKYHGDAIRELKKELVYKSGAG